MNHFPETMSRIAFAQPSQENIDLLTDITEQFRNLMDKVIVSIPESSRERSLCLTKIEEAFMWFGSALVDRKKA